MHFFLKVTRLGAMNLNKFFISIYIFTFSLLFMGLGVQELWSSLEFKIFGRAGQALVLEMDDLADSNFMKRPQRLHHSDESPLVRIQNRGRTFIRPIQAPMFLKFKAGKTVDIVFLGKRNFVKADNFIGLYLQGLIYFAIGCLTLWAGLRALEKSQSKSQNQEAPLSPSHPTELPLKPSTGPELQALANKCAITLVQSNINL